MQKIMFIKKRKNFHEKIFLITYLDDNILEITHDDTLKLYTLSVKNKKLTEKQKKELQNLIYEIFNNKLRITPQPEASLISYMWFEFSVDLRGVAISRSLSMRSSRRVADQ